MTTADLNGLTRDDLVNHRVTWLKTLGTEQTSHEKAFQRDRVGIV